MPLRTETTFEYYFNNASLYYCKEHDCFRVTEDHEDSILLNGIEQKDVNNFISNYIEYVLEEPELKVAYDQACKVKQLKEVADE